jgi:diguanylate cyclase
VAAPAAIAKGALRRLAQAQQEPTPENYARAYAEEAGQPAPPPAAEGRHWSALIERVVRNLERGGRQWTAARRKESLQRVFDGSRADPARLLQRLQALMNAWEHDQPADPEQTGVEDPPVELATDPGAWPPLARSLHDTVQAALPLDEPNASELATQLAAEADALAREGASAERASTIERLCQQARRLLGQRHRLVNELAALCREMGSGLAELAEDDSWVQGQCQALHAQLSDGVSVRGVRAAAGLLSETRQRQLRVQGERRAARVALKQLIQDMLLEVGELGEHTGRFQLATERHAQAIAAADSLQGMAGVVKTMLEDTRAVQEAVKQSQEKLATDRSRASELEAQVRALESELRRLSEEVSTDALTQVANRRGLEQAFEAESARAQRDEASTLAVALIDIDNFKKLNDSLGHAAGDMALKSLAAAVRERLRPVDHLARFGGEEFVVLLPGTEIAEAQQALTRLQRSLSEALFLHEGREVFVTFSAGVTPWRRGEALQNALERADEALYEAKRTGKNRTCIA